MCVIFGIVHHTGEMGHYPFR